MHSSSFPRIYIQPNTFPLSRLLFSSTQSRIHTNTPLRLRHSENTQKINQIQNQRSKTSIKFKKKPMRVMTSARFWPIFVVSGLHGRGRRREGRRRHVGPPLQIKPAQAHGPEGRTPSGHALGWRARALAGGPWRILATLLHGCNTGLKRQS